MLRRHWNAVRFVMVGSWVIGLGASPVMANQGHEEIGKRVGFLEKRLQLTDQQRGQVEQILNDYHTRVQSLHEQLEALRREQREKIEAVLTPQQKEKFEKMKEQRHGRAGLRRWQHDKEHES